MYLLAQLPAEVLKEQLGNGVILMVLGMAIVFVFLTILVCTTKLVSKLVGKIESKKPQVVSSPTSAPVAVSAAEAEVAVAIAAAMAKSKN